MRGEDKALHPHPPSHEGDAILFTPQASPQPTITTFASTHPCSVSAIEPKYPVWPQHPGSVESASHPLNRNSCPPKLNSIVLPSDYDATAKDLPYLSVALEESETRCRTVRIVFRFAHACPYIETPHLRCLLMRRLPAAPFALSILTRLSPHSSHPFLSLYSCDVYASYGFLP